MPIRPENKNRYPDNWNEIRLVILERADHCCENCGVADRSWGWRDQQGRFYITDKIILMQRFCRRPPFKMAPDQGRIVKIIEIVLTIAHLDHQPENCDGLDIFGKNIPEWAVPAVDRSNLRAWCQRCHLLYDSEHHSTTAAITRRQQLESAGQLRII